MNKLPHTGNHPNYMYRCVGYTQHHEKIRMPQLQRSQKVERQTGQQLPAGGSDWQADHIRCQTMALLLEIMTGISTRSHYRSRREMGGTPWTVLDQKKPEPEHVHAAAYMHVACGGAV